MLIQQGVEFQNEVIQNIFIHLGNKDYSASIKKSFFESVKKVIKIKKSLKYQDPNDPKKNKNDEFFRFMENYCL